MIRRLLNHLPNLRSSCSNSEEPFWSNAKRDEEINAATEPPPEESIRFVSVTLTEAYPPSCLPALMAGLQRLGVDREKSSSGDRQTPLAWIRAGRGDLLQRGWFNVGMVVSPDKRSFLAPSGLVDALLPASIDRVYLSLSHSRSLILATATFALADEGAGLLHVELLKKYETAASKVDKTRTTIHDPENQKRENVQLAVSMLTDGCTSWIRSNIPGLFSTFESSTEFPLINLIILESTEPFPGPPYSGIPKFLDILGLGREFRVWTSKELKGLKLSQMSRHPAFHNFVLAGRRHEILEEKDLQSYGGQDDYGLVNRLKYELEPMSRVLACHSVLTAFGRRVSLQTDQMASIELDKRSAAVKLHVIQKDIAKNNTDLMSLVPELAHDFQNDAMALHDVPKFLLSDQGISDEGLFESVRLNIVPLCAQIERASADLIANTTMIASLLSVEKQQQMQTKVLLFTIATFVATVTAVAIALSALLGSGG